MKNSKHGAEGREMGKKRHGQLSTRALIQFFIPLFPPREGTVRDLAQAHHQTQKDQAVSSLAPQCGQLQQSPVIYIQIRLALRRGLPAFAGTQPEKDYISCQELETV